MVLSGTDVVDFLFSLADSKDLQRSLETGDIMETMRGFLEDSELAKFFFTDSGAGITINMWPWIIASVLLLVSFPLLAGILSSLHVPMTAFYNAAVQNYGHGRNDYDEYYDDYESYDRYDSRDRVRDRDRNRDRERNRDKDFRKRRNQRPLRAQYKQEDDEDYSYSDSWKDDDYFRDFKDSWDRQAKELPDTVADPDMMSSWSDTLAQRVKLVN